MLDLTPATQLHSGAVDASPPPGRGPGRGRAPALDGAASLVLIGVSLVAVWSLLYLFVLSGFEQGRTQSSLYQDLRSEIAAGTAPVAAPIAAGAPVALLSAPDAGVRDAVVVEGTRAAQLQDGPGHQLGSVLPGQAATSVIAGRSLSFGAPFAHLADLAPGDPVRVTTGQGVFTYRVVGVRRDGQAVPPLSSEGAARLVLRTAERRPLGVGGTLFVYADLAEGAVPVTTKAAPDPDTGQMSPRLDGPTLALLVLALQLLLVALAAFTWAWSRWSRLGSWVALGPCVLAALWLCSSLGSRLLPGLV